MATYGDLITEVLQIIPSPGREPLIRSKINQIIRYVAGSGDYWKALEETTISLADGVNASSHIQQILVDSLFRAILYVQYLDSVSTNRIQCLNIKDVLHLRHCQKADDIAYVSGSYLRIKNSVLTDSFNIGYYVFPPNFATDGSEDNNSNWITEAIPGLIIDLVAAYILNLNGDNEDSKKATDWASAMQIPYIQAQVNGVINT